ncbi:MAG: ATP-binding cassette domain-containing protein [Rhodobacteraceae bacterium]|nr:ATP-binding cassette domain-containing protein [Paracoccaceae bacterium]
MGPSGGGKSTLLAAIAGFQPLAAGRILWGGRDLAPLAPGARPLSILFQDQNLFPHLTLAENVGLGLDPRLRLGRAEKARVAAVLARTGLAGKEGRRPAALSGGEQGRAALARALLRARPLLLLDEAFAALGPALKAEMLALLAAILDEGGATLLMVTHDPADARALTPATIVVAGGRADPPRPTPALLADPPPALAAYHGRPAPAPPAAGAAGAARPPPPAARG